MKHIVILYTTLYRTGGPKFVRAAETMAREKAVEFPTHRIRCLAVERKSEFVTALAMAGENGGSIDELHFIGHSGVYGIMFGTTDWPEQFSPHEWRTMQIPFSANGKAFFHACRTGRWFAAFFARTFKVPAYGHYLYTTVSLSPTRFVPETPASTKSDLYIIACPGRKSHGLFATTAKYAGLALATAMLEFQPDESEVDTSYDSVAELYDQTFSDIGVRRDEWNWLIKNREAFAGKNVLDLGCGNGAFLFKLSDIIESGAGVDISSEMLGKARLRCAAKSNLSFAKLEGPKLPFPDNSFDTVMSILSFRYLDWDPVMKEILRVLKPGGELLVVDMVASTVKFTEFPKLAVDKIKQMKQRMSEPRYFQALSSMVQTKNWQSMLKYNPIRAEHELRWYLESRLPGRKAEVINIGWNSRIMAFRSGAVLNKEIPEMQFP